MKKILKKSFFYLYHDFLKYTVYILRTRYDVNENKWKTNIERICNNVIFFSLQLSTQFEIQIGRIE